MPPRGRDGEAARAGATSRLQHLYELAKQDAERPGNIGAGLKVLEMLLNRADFRPMSGSLS